METQEYEDPTLPEHIKEFLQIKRKNEVNRILQNKYRKSMDNDEMHEIEPGQNVGIYNFLR